MDLDDLLDRATRWADGDPDPETRAELRRAVVRRDEAELRAAMRPPLAFGTAGLRGPVGPGPARMNRATVIRTTRALAEHVLARAEGTPRVVVGHDARPDSPRFARDVAAVLAAAGVAVDRFVAPVPTPLVAYAARTVAATAAVVVTASHNPPADNGYKVYGADATQISPPEDAEIAARIERVGPAAEIPLADPGAARAVRTLGEETASAYLDDVAAMLPPSVSPGPDDPVIVHTPLHGVAGALVLRALAEAGHRQVHPVASQAEPDGTFPTVTFPNPEEPGALDAALDEARHRDADLVLANDPDGDRLAVAVRDGTGHRVLTGNEVAVLLADHLLRHETRADPLVVSTIVSTPMLAAVAAAHGAHHETTLTGFKWIWRAALERQRASGWRLVLGAEEALGYAIDGVVRDKDGISAAVAVADLARALRRDGRTLLDRLDGLWARHGLWVGVQRAAMLPAGGPGAGVAALDRVAGRPPTRLGPRTVTEVVDHRGARAGAPPWLPASDLLECRLACGGRALLRPSGTEPKLKAYVDLRGGDPSPDARTRLHDEAVTVAEALLATAAS